MEERYLCLCSGMDGTLRCREAAGKVSSPENQEQDGFNSIPQHSQRGRQCLRKVIRYPEALTKTVLKNLWRKVIIFPNKY